MSPSKLKSKEWSGPLYKYHGSCSWVTPNHVWHTAILGALQTAVSRDLVALQRQHTAEPITLPSTPHKIEKRHPNRRSAWAASVVNSANLRGKTYFPNTCQAMKKEGTGSVSVPDAMCIRRWGPEWRRSSWYLRHQHRRKHSYAECEQQDSKAAVPSCEAALW